MYPKSTFAASNREAIAAMRGRYLDGLLEAQDALIEGIAGGADTFEIRIGDESVGYFLVADGALVEMFVEEPWEWLAQELFQRFVEAFAVTSAIVKTYDHLLMACAADLQRKVEMMGVLIRHYVPRPLPDIPRIRYRERVAEPADLERLWAVEQDAFTHRERLAFVVERGWVRIFERDDAVVGFGLRRPIISGRPHMEVGIAIDAPFRNKGYAVFILRDLVEGCLADGLVPVSGCARENEASIRAGVRIGFRSRYRILRFVF